MSYMKTIDEYRITSQRLAFKAIERFVGSEKAVNDEDRELINDALVIISNSHYSGTPVSGYIFDRTRGASDIKAIAPDSLVFLRIYIDYTPLFLRSAIYKVELIKANGEILPFALDVDKLNKIGGLFYCRD